MSSQYALLGLLEAEPRHGYSLKRDYDHWFGELRPIRYSQVYATLNRCQRDGLVELASEEPGQGPDRKRYAITPAGSDLLDGWLRQPEPAQPPVHAPLFVKVVLSLLSGRPTRDLLEAQRARHVERMRELVAARQDAPHRDIAHLDYAIFHLEADLRWLDHTAERLAPQQRP